MIGPIGTLSLADETLPGDATLLEGGRLAVHPVAFLAIVNSEHIKPIIYVNDGRIFEIRDLDQDCETCTFSFEVIREVAA